ncbi:hypothetical protein Q3G72_015627 [Acer saccharum]|nr:hypothetical protein Q3G72_015627 [Acer saccharum]
MPYSSLLLLPLRKDLMDGPMKKHTKFIGNQNLHWFIILKYSNGKIIVKWTQKTEPCRREVAKSSRQAEGILLTVQGRSYKSDIGFSGTMLLKQKTYFRAVSVTGVGCGGRNHDDSVEMKCTIGSSGGTMHTPPGVQVRTSPFSPTMAYSDEIAQFPTLICPQGNLKMVAGGFSGKVATATAGLVLV